MIWQEKGLLRTVFRTSPRVRLRLAVPDVHAERSSHNRACATDTPGPLGAHVGRFDLFWPIGQTARHTLRSARAAPTTRREPLVPSLGVRRGQTGKSPHPSPLVGRVDELLAG